MFSKVNNSGYNVTYYAGFQSRSQFGSNHDLHNLLILKATSSKSKQHVRQEARGYIKGINNYTEYTGLGGEMRRLQHEIFQYNLLTVEHNKGTSSETRYPSLISDRCCHFNISLWFTQRTRCNLLQWSLLKSDQTKLSF